MRRLGLLCVISVLLLGTGCSSLNFDKNIVSVKLVCNERAINEACVDKEYKDRAIIKSFVNVIKSAVKMQGALDYEEEYEMTLISGSGEERKYHLSLTPNRDLMGLLLELPNTSTGYQISKKNANKLRDIIFSS
jgi:hypothetical protein